MDAGHGWLIFALPPTEAAFHPSEDDVHEQIYFMCDDLKTEMASLAKKGVKCSKVEEARWGFHHEDASSQWWQSRPLSAKAPNALVSK